MPAWKCVCFQLILLYNAEKNFKLFTIHLIFEVWLLIRNQRPGKPQDIDFHASQIEYCNFDSPSWIFENFRIWLHICITGMILKFVQKVFSDFSRVRLIHNLQNKPLLTNILRWFLCKWWISESTGTYMYRQTRKG